VVVSTSTTPANRMRIGWLTYGVERPLSGISRQALELGRALGRREDCELVYLTPYRRGPFRQEANCDTFHLVGCSRLPAMMLLGGVAIAVAARRRRLDLVHDPSGIAPFPFSRPIAPFRRVVTIHDAIGFRDPGGYPWLNRLLQRRYLPAMLPNVDAVITVSRHARADLEHFLPRLPLPAYVVPPALSGQFRPVREEERRPALARLGLQRPYILSVGAMQERKNLRRLVRAFARLHARRPEYQLVLAGPTLWRYTSLWDEIAQAGVTPHVVIPGYVADADLAALYSGAALFAFPSRYEGFGMPVLEAMACATPVVCSNTTSLPEAAGDAALLVDPLDVEALAAAMQRVLDDQPLADRLRRAGTARARLFSWDRAAAQTAAVYRRLLGPAGLPE
jgi:glycosyltransferase involved in cell wall biosynthesis